MKIRNGKRIKAEFKDYLGSKIGKTWLGTDRKGTPGMAPAVLLH